MAMADDSGITWITVGGRHIPIRNSAGGSSPSGNASPPPHNPPPSSGPIPQKIGGPAAPMLPAGTFAKYVVKSEQTIAMQGVPAAKQEEWKGWNKRIGGLEARMGHISNKMASSNDQRVLQAGKLFISRSQQTVKQFVGRRDALVQKVGGK